MFKQGSMSPKTISWPFKIDRACLSPPELKPNFVKSNLTLQSPHSLMTFTLFAQRVIVRCFLTTFS